MASSPTSNSKHAIVPLLPVSYQPNSIKSQNYYTPWSPSTKRPSCWKPIITTLILLISLPFILVSIVAGSRIYQKLTIGPQAPLARLTSLSIHKFNISETNLTAEWDVKLTIQNPDLVSSISFDRAEGFVMSEDTGPLTLQSMEPFTLAMRTEKEVHMKLVMNRREGDQPALKEGVLQKMIKDREMGGVRFSVQMAIWATYRNAWLWSKQQVIMNPQCLDLPVAFVSGTTAIGFRILTGPVLRTCDVPMLDE